jgi:hypothetical protein
MLTPTQNDALYFAISRAGLWIPSLANQSA